MPVILKRIFCAKDLPGFIGFDSAAWLLQWDLKWLGRSLATAYLSGALRRPSEQKNRFRMASLGIHEQSKFNWFQDMESD